MNTAKKIDATQIETAVGEEVARSEAPARGISGWSGRLPGLIDAVPALVTATYGAAWISLHASDRGYVHTLFQVGALIENVVALLLRRRKPLGSLVGILVVYLIVDLEPLTLLPALLALGTVVTISRRRSAVLAVLLTAGVMISMPYLHGDPVDFVTHSLWHVLAVGFAASLGVYLRARRPSEGRAQTAPDRASRQEV